MNKNTEHKLFTQEIYQIFHLHWQSNKRIQLLS